MCSFTSNLHYIHTKKNILKINIIDMHMNNSLQVLKKYKICIMQYFKTQYSSFSSFYFHIERCFNMIIKHCNNNLKDYLLVHFAFATYNNFKFTRDNRWASDWLACAFCVWSLVQFPKKWTCRFKLLPCVQHHDGKLKWQWVPLAVNTGTNRYEMHCTRHAIIWLNSSTVCLGPHG